MMKFNKRAATPYFKRKVKLAIWIMGAYHCVTNEVGTGGYTRTGIFKDLIRGVYLEVYTEKKVKGLGTMQFIDCHIRWSEQYHPEHKGRHLSKQDMKVYFDEYDKNS